MGKGSERKAAGRKPYSNKEGNEEKRGTGQ